jgi:hypothetical protein
MDRLTAEHTRFPLSAHALFSQSARTPDQLIDNLERAVREVAALSHPLPLVSFERDALTGFKRLQRRTQGHPRLAMISGYVAFKLNVKSDQLFSKCRNDRVAFCRAVAIYVCRSLTCASFPALGEHFGRNHSSCIHAYQLIAQRIESDAEFRNTIEQIERSLSHVTTGTLAAAYARPSNRKDRQHATAPINLSTCRDVRPRLIRSEAPWLEPERLCQLATVDLA